MKIKIITVGKTDEDYLISGIEKYLKRLKHYCAIEYIELPPVKNASSLNPEKLKEEEGKLILSKAGSDQIILLDENGTEFKSVEFSKFLQKKMNSGISEIVFVIGGAFGFSPMIYEKAKDKISLSRMTFSHQMVRLFLVEQVYRGFTILKGEKYHHE